MADAWMTPISPIDASLRNVLVAFSTAAVLMSCLGAFACGAVLNFVALYSMSALVRAVKEEK